MTRNKDADMAAAVATSSGAAAGAGPRLTPAAAAKANEMGKRIAAAFGEIVGVLMRTPQHRHAFLADLEWLVLPPIGAGQFALAEARHKESGLAFPVAVILWASVSDEVDARLRSTAGSANGQHKLHLRLKPDEWTSGPNAWLIEAAGDRRAVKALIDQTLAGRLEGRGLNALTRAADGRSAIQLLGGSDTAPASAHGVAAAKAARREAH